MNAEKHSAQILRDQADIYENVLSEHFIYIKTIHVLVLSGSLIGCGNHTATATTTTTSAATVVVFSNREKKWMVIQIYPSHFGPSNDPSCSSDRLMMKNYEEH